MDTDTRTYEDGVREGKIAAANEIADRILKARTESQANAYGAEIVAREYAKSL